jgi:hypothetical protein
MPSHIEDTNRALEEHLEQTKTRDTVIAALAGLVFGAVAYLLLGTGGATSTGGISPTMTTSEGRPVLGALAGLVGAAVVGRVLFTQLRLRRRRRFWGL